MLARHLRFDKSDLTRLWTEHAGPFLLYTFLSVLLSWPMVRDFTTAIPGNSNDAHNGLWVLWHTKEALLGRVPLFDLPLLYYPAGASILTHVPGPTTGLLALPFWPWGPEAANNGALLLGLSLTGTFMYWLARGLGFERRVAFFAGLMLLLAPMHLAGLLGHMTKVYLGATPLTLLAFHYALDPKRSGWWSVTTAVALLFTFLHDSFQFIVTAIALAFFAVVALLAARLRSPFPLPPDGPAERPRLWSSGWGFLLRRILLTGAVTAIIVGPLLVATALAALDPEISINNNLQSYVYQPDLVELFLPPTHSALFGAATLSFLQSHDLGQTIETVISLSWIGILLCLLALVSGRYQARIWLLFTLLWILLSLGPRLQWLSWYHFTEYRLPLILPYAFFTALPGLDFLRTPGRFVQIGYVGLAISAAFGLAWLMGRFPRRANLLLGLAVFALFAEWWPQPWPQMELRPVPAFYQQLAADGDRYGVLDLPFSSSTRTPHIVYSTHYQMYQMTHKKGIAMGYISRTYNNHPLFPCLIPELLPPPPDLFVNGHPATCHANALFELAHYNYRYVVFHKPQPEYPDYQPGSWGEESAVAIIDQLFGAQPPLVDDQLTRVYVVPPVTSLEGITSTVEFGENWYTRENDWRWAGSPAQLITTMDREQDVILEITPAMIHDPGPGRVTGDTGRLTLSLSTGFSTTVEIHSEQMTAVPLTLPSGVQTLTLTLEAGNFRPADHRQPDPRRLAFAIRSINLRTDER